MNLYRTSIILFGLVLPLIAAGGIAVASTMLKSKMSVSLVEKQQHFKSYEQTCRAVSVAEGEIGRNRAHVERWKQQLGAETASEVASTLRDITDALPAKEIEQTAFDPRGGTGGFGAVTTQKSSQIRIAFRGSYRTMQQAFLELESRLPQLQLQELKISPNPSQPSIHNYQVTYTAWEQ